MTLLPSPDLRGARYRSLFDAAWYLGRYPEIARHEGDPFSHYVSNGRTSGYAPNAFFDPTWYRARYREVAAANLDPFWHYVVRGESLGNRPNPLFHTLWYASRHGLGPDDSPLHHFLARPESAELAPNPLFDPGWYREEHGLNLADAQHPLSHYLESGFLRLRPHPLFDPVFYLERYPEVAAPGQNPLAHFLDVGAAAGYQPNPYFDTDWYRERYLKGDNLDENPLVHFVEIGARAGCRPHPFFDTGWYRDRYPAVRRSGANPLAHYISNRGSPAGGEAEWEPNAFFDSTWYRSQHRELLPSRQTFDHHLHSKPHRALLPNRHFERYAEFFSSHLGGIHIHEREDNPLREYFAAGLAEPTIEAKEAFFGEAPDPDVTVIVPAFNQFSHTLACLRSVAAARTRCRFEVLLADDASDEVDFATELETLGGLRVIRSASNQGFLENCNAAAREARGRFLVFLNNDTVVTDDWLDELLATPHRFPDVGIVGSKLLFPNGRVAEAGCVVWEDGSAWNYGRRRAEGDLEVDYAREVDYVSGASLLIERSFFEELGGFDAAYRPAYYEDTDLGFRVRRAGRRVLYQAASRVIHFEAVSSRHQPDEGMKANQARNRAIFLEQWQGELCGRRPEGQQPDLEKDRYAPRRALFFDVCTPSSTRDARSIRLVEMMKIVRDEGYRVTFIPENLDTPEPFRTQLKSLGIRVVGAAEIASPGEYLAREGPTLDLVVAARRPLAERWLESIRRHCTNARVVFDAIDLIDRETLERAHEDLGPGATSSLSKLLGRVDASFVATDSAGGESELHSGTENGSPGRPAIHLVGRIFDGLTEPLPRSERAGVYCVTGFHRAATADALVWLAKELLPRLAKRAPGIRFWVQDGDLARELVGGSPGVRLLAERELLQPGRLERFALALFPSRFGGRLEGPIQMLLARGLPCVATEHAAGALSSRFTTGIQLAHSTREFEEAIASLLEDEALDDLAARDALRGMEPLLPTERIRREIRSAIQP